MNADNITNNNNNNNNNNNIPILESIDDDFESEKSDDNNDLDVSWIQEQERLQDIQKNYCREPISNIDLFSIYINHNLYIDKIICEKQVLEPHENNVDSILKKECLLKLIQSKKLFTPDSKYKLIDILKYNVELEPENIQSYSKTENIVEKSAGFFKVHPIIDDIVISPSIFIFHGINAIYLIFQEVKTEKHRHTVKSILKHSKIDEISASTSSHKSTKKVRINDSPNDIVLHHKPASKQRTTRKIFPKVAPK